MTFRQKTMAKLGKEPATPGYTGYIPAMRNHLIGHSYGDSTRRAAACTDSLRHREYSKAIELTVESRPQDRNFFYAQLSRAALEQPPKAIKWICSKRDLPPDMDATSGLMDIRKMKTCIGTTPAGVTTCAPHMSIPDGPYKDRKICTRRTFEKLKDDVLEVAEARHHIKGYSGHTHAKQHIYGKSYGKVTRILRPLPANPKTSREYLDYADSRALVVNEFELKQAGMKPNMAYKHFNLLAPGHKPGGPGVYVERMLENASKDRASSSEVCGEEGDDCETSCPDECFCTNPPDDLDISVPIDPNAPNIDGKEIGFYPGHKDVIEPSCESK
ncbi:unnamed protein product [Calypogeia fissa]